ncbi:hypothetical protein ACHAXA_000084 [Cyclostephanos tholiformis]|uniref:Uncharacterized protein n=1 Tax=Cyclostephanos tholiformis TaxID=382380 RepID=A0ABD3RW39_9STRA
MPRERRLPPRPLRGDGDVIASVSIRDGDDGEDDVAAITTSSSSSSSPPPTMGLGVMIPPSLTPHLGWTRMSYHSSKEDKRRRRSRRFRERRNDDDDAGGEGGVGGGIRTKVAGRAVVSSS